MVKQKVLEEVAGVLVWVPAGEPTVKELTEAEEQEVLKTSSRYLKE